MFMRAILELLRPCRKPASQPESGRRTKTRRWAVLAIAFLVLFGSSAIVAESGRNSVGPCMGASGSPHLVLETARGLIRIAVRQEAAPSAVARLFELVPGPVFNETLFPGNQVGYYDGLVFGYIRASHEIRTSERAPDGLVTVPNEIDAVALGLNEDVVENVDEAMDVMQTELLKAYTNTKGGRSRTAKLNEWLGLWYQDLQPDFLIGESRKTINEALGYQYQEGLASLPVTRGSVALVPVSPRESTLKLSIALTDFTDRSGRSMVIGVVVEGMEIAEEISRQPLRDPMTAKTKEYKPLEPVIIARGHLECD